MCIFTDGGIPENVLQYLHKMGDGHSKEMEAGEEMPERPFLVMSSQTGGKCQFTHFKFN